MIGRAMLLTNNPAYSFLPLPAGILHTIQGSALDVCLGARDRIHLGAALHHHPLYGNFQPRHQPYRSLLLSIAEGPSLVDDFSLQLLEEALRFFAKDRPLLPEDIPVRMRRDCALLDFELMRRPLIQAGLLEDGVVAPEYDGESVSL